MEIFNAFYDFFGFELLADASTFVDWINAITQILIGLFIVFFFLRSVFLLMVQIGNGGGFLDD